MAEKIFPKDTSEGRAWVGGRYFFQVGDTLVRVRFNPGGEPLGRKLEDYFSGLRG